MAQVVHPDGSVEIGTGWSREFARQHHPTDEEKALRILVEEPPVVGGLPLRNPVRLWVLPEDLTANRDYFTVVDPADAERKLSA